MRIAGIYPFIRINGRSVEGVEKNAAWLGATPRVS